MSTLNKHKCLFTRLGRFKVSYLTTSSSNQMSTKTINNDNEVETSASFFNNINDELESSSCSNSHEKTDYTNQFVFKNKKLSELFRAMVVLKASSFDPFVKYSDKLFLLGRRILWTPIFSFTMRHTFYGQFAAGLTVTEATPEVNKLLGDGIRPMLCVPIESATFKTEEEARLMYNRSKEMILESIYGTAEVDNHGFAQMKLTSLCDKQILLEMNPYLIQYETNHDEPGDWNIQRVANLLENRQYDKIKFSVLSEINNRRLQLLLQDIDELARACEKHDVRMMIDAEQTYIQSALGWLILVLQAKYNKEKILVYNTYQCYRKDTLTRIQADHSLGEKLGFKIAGKLVRGAYMVEERRLATENNYEDPINRGYEATNAKYHECVDFVLPLVKKKQVGIMIASHNEDTADYVKARMAQLNINQTNPLLSFGQIYGMCDHVSFYLGSHGYQVFKSIPYGTIDDTMLYLARRAHENRSVLERTTFERFLIRKELKRRAFAQ